MLEAQVTARALPERLTAVLGPTNTGKTHLAVERMLARRSGVIGLPLRLLAREVYDRVVRAKGAGSAALITGEEKIVPKSASYFVCTAESMPLSMDAAFVAIDEVQLAGDAERGHIFTDRLLHARGTEETMFMGAASMAGLIRRLVPEAELDARKRFSQLSYSGPSRLTRLPRRSAVVAFSAESVYAIAEVLRRKRGGAAVVMGALSPRTRNAQVELYQSGEVDYLVATDAIGMGLNMDVDHVAFAETRKFDGRRMRRLTAAELAQIAGRAGRFRSDGTFGETGECRPFDPDVVEAIESHSFPSQEKLLWRNADLDLSGLDALIDSLRERSPDPVLERVRESSDEAALGVLADDQEIRDMARGRAEVSRLWEACRLPDFRRATLDAHARLVKSIYRHLMGPGGRLPDTWLNGQLERIDKTGGDVDVLSNRLAHVRTWAYAANRSDWTHDAEHWRGRAREIEDKLSDALHERLMQRFVDRRTSALVKGLRDDKDMLAGVSAEGEVTVEGHYLGRLNGLVFQPDARGAGLEARALRGAALKALRPEINRRLGALAQAEDLSLELDGRILSGGELVARLTPGEAVLRPRISLVGGELGAAEAGARALAGLERWLQGEIAAKLGALDALKTAAGGDTLGGVARGLAFRLHEAGGALARRQVAEEVKQLSPAERRSLRMLGVRIGEHLVFMPGLVKPAAAQLNALLCAFGPEGDRTPFLPAAGLTSTPAEKRLGRAALTAAGFHLCGPRAVRFDMLERLADQIREARSAAQKEEGGGKGGRFAPGPEMMALLGCSVEDLRSVLGALGYRRVKRGEAPEKLAGELWAPRRRKAEKPAPKAPEPPADSPFAALAALRGPEPRRKPARKPRPKRRRSAEDTG
jgi:ATP-dependent RNA helicase SUPV3L1/SUV3